MLTAADDVPSTFASSTCAGVGGRPSELAPGVSGLTALAAASAGLAALRSGTSLMTALSTAAGAVIICWPLPKPFSRFEVYKRIHSWRSGTICSHHFVQAGVPCTMPRYASKWSIRLDMIALVSGSDLAAMPVANHGSTIMELVVCVSKLRC